MLSKKCAEAFLKILSERLEILPWQKRILVRILQVRNRMPSEFTRREAQRASLRNAWQAWLRFKETGKITTPTPQF